MNSLIYTIAFDRPGSTVFASMARLLVLSLRHSGCDDEILVLTNNGSGLFPHGIGDVREIVLDTSHLDPRALGIVAKEYKFKVREFFRPEDYDQILYIDCDCLALANVTEKLSSAADLSYAVETWGKITDNAFSAYLSEREMKNSVRDPINSGIFRINSGSFDRVMQQWEQIYESPRLRPSGCVDQPAWVRVVLDEGETADQWRPSHLIRYPLAESMNLSDYREAAILHYCGSSGIERLNHMICDYLLFHKPKYLEGVSQIIGF